MALDIKIKTNAKAIEKRFKRLESKFPSIIDKGILQGGFQLLDIIRTKTAKGIDFRDRPFAPYSSGYLKKLNKEGKSTKVDLFYSGRMLGALTPSGRTVKKTGKNKREFFGFNDKTANIIRKQLNRFVEKEFRKMRT